MNMVGSFSDSVSMRSAKSSLASGEAAGSGGTMSEVSGDGERARGFDEFLEPAPGDAQPVPTPEQAAPVAAKPSDAWQIKSIASLIPFIGEPLAGADIEAAADFAVDDAATNDDTGDNGDTAVENSDATIDALAVPVTPPPPTQPQPQKADAEISSGSEQPQTAVAGPSANPQQVAGASETATARTQASAQQAGQASAQSGGQPATQASQQRRAKPADAGEDRTTDSASPDSAAAKPAAVKTDGPEPQVRSAGVSQRETASSFAGQQSTLTGEGEGKAAVPKGTSSQAAPGLMSSAAATEASEQEDAFKSANVKSVSQEAHFMLPSHRTEPARQIGAAVVAEVAQTAAGQPADAARPKDPIVKVLDLHLEPRELGSVHLRMQLSHGAMTLAVKVETEELASRLQRDSDILTKMLQSSGIALDNLVVQSVGVDRTSFSGNDPSMSQKNQDASANQANANSSGANEGRARGDETGQGQRREGEPADRFEPVAASNRAQARAPGTIYI